MKTKIFSSVKNYLLALIIINSMNLMANTALKKDVKITVLGKSKKVVLQKIDIHTAVLKNDIKAIKVQIPVILTTQFQFKVTT